MSIKTDTELESIYHKYLYKTIPKYLPQMLVKNNTKLENIYYKYLLKTMANWNEITTHI